MCVMSEFDIIMPSMGASERYMDVDGLLYSRLGLGIKCVNDAWINSYVEANFHGIPRHSTKAWVEMIESMRAMDAQIQTAEDFELEMPCYTLMDGSDPYYTPLQHLCVLYKRWRFPWIIELAEKLTLRGASHDMPDSWDMETKAHATRMLTCLKSGGPRPK